MLAALLGLATVFVSRSATAQDHSLRVGIFNTYMKPTPGFTMCASVPTCHGLAEAGVAKMTTDFCGVTLEGVLVGAAAAAAGGGAAGFAFTGFECHLAPHEYDTDEVVAGARRTAQRIIAGGYDLIVLNEVFEHQAKKALMEELLAEYPNILVDAHARDHQVGEDSGLMVFARSHLQFDPLEANLTCGSDDAAVAMNLPDVFPFNSELTARSMASGGHHLVWARMDDTSDSRSSGTISRLATLW